jgi:hypothetical protein
MKSDEQSAGTKLLETGALVDFQVLDTHIESSPDGENLAVRVELVCAGEEEDDPGDVVEWGAFGFVLATLSFVDARPRGLSEVDYVEGDELNIVDLFDGLRFSCGELHFRADYIRGRCVKTDVTVRPDGTVTLTTWGRGQSALRWLDRLNCKRLMQAV